MKKLLLLLAGLLFAILPSVAQTSYVVSSTGITRGEDLTSGDYLIYAIPDGTKTPGYVHYYAPNDPNKSNRHYLTYPLDISSGIVSDPMYIWTVTKTPQNNFEVVLKSDPTKFWIDDDQWGQNMTGSQNKAVLITEDSEQGIKFRPAEEMKNNNGTSATNTYMNCNGPMGENNAYTSLSYWGGSNGAATFIFYKVKEKTDNYPFICSDAPTAEGFSPNTYWYYMTVREKYVTHDEKLDYCPASATNPVNYGSFWAFVKNEAGQIEIYNAATGPNYVLASSTPTGDGGSTCPIMKEKNTLAGTEKGVWNIKHTGSDKFFFLNFPGVDNAYMNYREPKLAFWVHGSSNADDGSKLRVQEVDINTLINTVREQQSAVSGAVGTLVGESYAAFTAALNKGTAEGLAEALKIRDLTGTTVQFDPSKYYRIENVTRKRSTGNAESVGNGGYLEYADKKEVPIFGHAFYAYDKGADRAGAIWKFEAVEGTEGAYKLQSLNSKQYIKSGNPTSATTQEEATRFKLAKLSATAQFNIVTADNIGNRLHVTGQADSDKGNVIIYTDGGANTSSAWYIIPATTIDVTISSAKYATVNYPFAVQLPEDGTIAAYTANAIPGNNSELLLKKVADGFIPANTPVVLEGDAKTYTLNIVAGDKTEPLANNILEGTTLFEAKDRETKVYVLGNNETKGVGFYKLSDAEGANRTITANKAYLPATNLSGTAQMTKGFTFSFDDNSGETTGIEDATINLAEEEFYDLQGRRVLNPTKGIYVTKSGKKILFTK